MKDRQNEREEEENAEIHEKKEKSQLFELSFFLTQWIFSSVFYCVLLLFFFARSTMLLDVASLCLFTLCVKNVRIG